MQKLIEGCPNPIEVAAVVLQVVRINVGHDRDDRGQAQEAAITFVCFGDQPVTTP